MGSYSGEYSSLAAFYDDPLVLLTLSVLIVVGGLGFFVWEDVLSNGIKGLSLYSRLVFKITAWLIVGGTLFFLLVEGNNPLTMGGMGGVEKLLNSFFQSVTLRTAGFSTLSQSAMDEGAQVLSVLFMLVGGSSGSTAGGLKTVTVAVLFLSLQDSLLGRNEVVVHGRTIPQSRVNNAMTLTLIVILLFLAGSMTITVMTDFPFMSVAFEVASAMGTVGLSAGITPDLGIGSSLIVTALMYLGRVGILSFSIAFLTQNQPSNKIHYPTVDIMVG